MSAWRVKVWRFKLATEKIELIVIKSDGLASIDEIIGRLVTMPGTMKYRKLHEKGRLGHFIMVAVKRSKILKLIPYFDGSGSKKYIVIHNKEGDS